MKSVPMSEVTVERSATVCINMSWYAQAVNKLATRATCSLLEKFLDMISEVHCFNDILQTVENAAMLCPGNPDTEIVELFKHKGKYVKCDSIP